MKKLRAAVIGMGFGARVHVPAYQLHPQYELVGLAAMRPGRAKEIGASLGVPGFSDWKKLLHEVPLDVVSIATDPSWHREMAVYAMERGIHVLCEKPMALSLAEAASMVRAGAYHERAAFINHEFRYFKARQIVKEWIDTGRFGVPICVVMEGGGGGYDAVYQRSVNWLAQETHGGGFLGAIGSHWIDTLRWWLGDVQYVAGELLRDVPLRAEGTARADDGFAGFLRLASGASASLAWRAASPPARGTRFEVMGTDATLRVDNDETVWVSRESVWEPVALPNVQWPAAVPADAPRLLGNLVALLDDMARVIEGEAPSPLLVPFSEGYEVMRVMDAWIKSYQSGIRHFLL